MKEIWKALLKPLRYTSSGPQILTDDSRSPFCIDQDRILFSSSFRRLSKKTQVHPLTRNDHIHSRLSHSLEVASVARTIGLNIGTFLRERDDLPDDFEMYQIGEIVYAACLAHDIGNPPFGHGGESAIQDWFKDPANEQYIGTLKPIEKSDFFIFDGNAQGLRVLTALENNKDSGGLRLTFPTLAATVKYPRSSHDAVGLESKKFNFYQSEKKLFDEVYTSLGLKNGKYLRHPLAYITEAADDICYRIIDIEDAHELKIITVDDILAVVSPIYRHIGLDRDKFYKIDSDRRRIGMLRTLIIGHMTRSVAKAFKENYSKIMEGDIFSLIDLCDDDSREYMKNAKDIFYNKIANEPKKLSLEIGAYSMYKILLDRFIQATFNKIVGDKISRGALSYKDLRSLDLMGVNAPLDGDDLYVAYHRVIDFVTGMTDAYATYISRQFSGTGSGQ